MKNFLKELKKYLKINEKNSHKFLEIPNNLKEEILELTKNLPIDCSFNQRCYNLLNNLQEIPFCTICNKNRCKYSSFSGWYRETCSKECYKQYCKPKFENIKRFLEIKGVKNSMDLKEVKDKLKETNLKKYWVDNVFKSTEFQEKRKKTLIKRYWEGNASNIKEFQEKRKQTNLKKYWVDNFFSSEAFAKLRKRPSKESIEKTKIGLKNNYLKELNIYLQTTTCKYVKEIDRHHIQLFCNHCNKEFVISKCFLKRRRNKKQNICLICNIKRPSHSIAEKDLVYFIKSIYSWIVK